MTLRRKPRPPFEWLDRRIALPGPYLALVLSEAEFILAAKFLGVSEPGPWLRTDHSDATAHTFTHPGKANSVVVALQVNEGWNAIEIAGLLVHEAVHIWQRYAEDMGEHRPGDEQEAYAIQTIAQELMSEYARRIRAKKSPHKAGRGNC